MQKILNIIVCMLLFVSCSQIDILEQEQSNERESSWHTAVLSLHCTKQGFDSNGVTTRATSTTTWQDGDKIYLRFSNGATMTQGNAVYNAPENAWYINYYGTLTRDKEMNVEVYYFENPESVTEEEVKLSPTSAVYHDAEAKYIYPSGGDLTVTTTLSPSTSRVRFKGQPGTQINVIGLQTPNLYNVNSSNYNFIQNSVTLCVLNSGYTDFIYSNITGDRTLSIENGDYRYTKNIDNSYFSIGRSGWMAIPTITNHAGWESLKYTDTFLKVNISDGNIRKIVLKGLNGELFEGIEGNNNIDTLLYSSDVDCQKGTHVFGVSPRLFSKGFELQFHDDNGDVAFKTYHSRIIFESQETLDVETMNTTAYYAVDLGITSNGKRLLFSKDNMSSTFQYGAVNPGDSYWTELSNVDAAHDCAYQNWGPTWRLPNSYEFQLLGDCDWDNGAVFYGKDSQYRKKIVLPAVGYYWTSTYDGPYSGKAFNVTSGVTPKIEGRNRKFSYYIRPVCEFE